MLKANLKKIKIKNFKSLHDCEIDAGKLNILVGKNASGKSNLIEAFKLLKRIYREKEINPFFEWWGYNNIVWQRKEGLPITIGLLFEICNYEVYFETTFTGVGGKFSYVREIFDIKNNLRIEKEGDWITIKQDPVFIDNLIKNIRDYVGTYGVKSELKREKSKLISERKVNIKFEKPLIELFANLHFWGRPNLKNKRTGESFAFLNLRPYLTEEDFKDRKKFRVIIPYVYLDKDTSHGSTIFEIALKAIQSFINELLIICPLNIRSMKEPHRLKRETVIKEDGSNISSVFHSIYLKEGKIPDEVKIPLSMVFPDLDVRPELTEDGRVMIKIFEKDLELLPPNISDGLYKVLAILLASYLNPPLLLIDEIEDSLHPETLELILDTIKRSESQAIITTHSPVVIDIVEPKDIILAEKEYDESKFRRVKDPEKIKSFLHEKGFTFSEGWLYGSLFQEE